MVVVAPESVSIATSRRGTTDVSLRQISLVFRHGWQSIRKSRLSNSLRTSCVSGFHS